MQELSPLPTTNDAQETLLDNEETVKDDYTLSYRFVIQIFFIFTIELIFFFNL